MARSKANRRKKSSVPRRPRVNELPKSKRDDPQFYEAMPMAMPSMVISGAASAHLGENVREVQQAAQATSRRIGFAARSLFENISASALATWTATVPAREYTAAGLSDVVQGVRRVTRPLTTRKAKYLYAAVLVSAAMSVFVGGTIAAEATYAKYANEISHPAVLFNKKKTGTTILDRNGVVLYRSDGAQSNDIVPLAKLPNTLKQATLAAEDPEFYNHSGISWQGTARAAWVDILSGQKAEGGSTLTQQLVKNVFLTSTKSFERKFQEVILSMDLEHKYSKDQILEMYLNEVYYGQGSNGVQAASQAYFRKDAKDLTLSQSAFIAGLPLGPTRFDPNMDAKAAVDRRNYILDRMASLGMISSNEAQIARAEPLNAQARNTPIRAPHFVFYVLDQLRAQYGAATVESGGITVITTLDITKQDQAQAIVAAQVAKLAGHNASNGGLVSVVPATGDIIAMVGSVDYNKPGFGAVNVTLSNLQPGSSFKPIAYVTAFMKGWNGSNQVDDKPIKEPNGDGTTYEPQNYDLKFRGPVTLRRALANSLNIPAIEVLKFATIPSTLDMAHKLGITTLNDPSRYGLSLVLGGGEVRPLDMATVYATFANAGTRVAPRSILSVTDRYGVDITKGAAAKPVKALEAKYASMITSILSDNQARTEEFGANSPLKLSRPAAAKTGTTNDFRDNWTVGYTPDLATAVWVGNNDHSAMSNVDGITGAAPIWHDFMEAALAGTPVTNFTISPDVSSFHVCQANGGLIDGGTPGYTELAPTDTPITRKCDLPRPTPPSPTAEPNPVNGDPVDPGRGPGDITQALKDQAKALRDQLKQLERQNPGPIQN